MKDHSFREYIIEYIAVSSGADREIIAKKIIDEEIKIPEFLDILFLDPPICTRFSWLLGDLSSRTEIYIVDIITFCLNNLDKIKVPDIDRVIAKQAMLNSNALEEETEGLLLEHLFESIASSYSSVSTQRYSFLSLKIISKKYPDLLTELKLILLEKKEYYSESFKKLVIKEFNDPSFFD